MLIPASEANTNLCKTLFSAAVLDYPSPTLINFGKHYDNPDLIFGGSHMAKINGVLDHLNTFNHSKYDDDIVVLVDGYDMWFQLRPEVLLQRYFATNLIADMRVRKQVGIKAAEELGLRQKVIFSAQKRCWPKGPESASCWAVPESTLPLDVYGPQTDTELPADNENPFLNFRQRFLNSGMAVGTVAGMRAVFARASAKAAIDVGFGSDQGVFAEIFGEQEFQRHCIAKRYRTGWISWVQQKLGLWKDVTEPVLAEQEGRAIMECAAVNDTQTWEFGLGLDYDMTLSQPTVFSEYDTAWLRRGDAETTVAAASSLGLAEKITSPRVSTTLPVDIEHSRMPFEEMSLMLPHYYKEADIPFPHTSWNQVPLFTNLYTGVSPVAIHHNAHRNGLKGRIDTHWNETWFQPYLRMLMDSRLLEPSRPVVLAVDELVAASLEDDGTGAAAQPTFSQKSRVREVQKTFWAPHSTDWENERAAVTTDGRETRYYDGLCQDWMELFRDGKGEWRDPNWRTEDGDS